MKKLIVFSLAFILVFAFFAGCKKKVKEVPPPPQVKEQPKVEKVEEPVIKEPVLSEEEIFMSKSLEQINREQPLAMIHFDYDKYFIREDAKPVLERNAAWMKKFRTVKILVEGHCDERGTEEYNLALGEKRAKSAMDYLASLGHLRRPDEDPFLRQEPAARRAAMTRRPGRRTGAPSSSSSKNKPCSKERSGACLLVLMPLWSAGGADKTKKVYELIYDDVQVLKKQVQDLPARAQKNAEDIQLIKDQLKELGDLVRRSQTDQLGLREDLRSVPQQYQALAGKIEQLSLDVAKLAELCAERSTPARRRPRRPRPSPPRKAGTSPNFRKRSRRISPSRRPCRPTSLPRTSTTWPTMITSRATSTWPSRGSRCTRTSSPTARWPTTPSTGSASAITARGSSRTPSTCSTSSSWPILRETRSRPPISRRA